MMTFFSDHKIDAYCWDQLNKQSTIFGETKKMAKVRVDRNVVRRFSSCWKPGVNKEFRRGMQNIFGKPFPKKWRCHINSTPYSMEIPEGISISAGTATPIRTICHEANHVMFRKNRLNKKYFPTHDVEDAKEIFTILNNIYFQKILEQQDIGWKKFWKERYQFLVLWFAQHPGDIPF